MTIRNPLVLVNGRISELPVGDSLASAAPINTGAVQQLGKVVCSGSQSTVTFSNIPQNFTNLRIAYQGQASTGDLVSLFCKINSDATAGNYAANQWHDGFATTSTAAADTPTTAGGIPAMISSGAGKVTTGEIFIRNYAGTVFNKAVHGICYASYTSARVRHEAFVWLSVAAINRLDLSVASGNFTDGTTFLLLGEGPINYSVSPFVDPALCNGRLSLTSGVPITTADVIGATTIYWTPYKGNRISLYSNGAWSILSSAEVSLALGTLTSAKNYDIFAFNNNGVLSLEFLVWTSDTARATALVMQDGVYVKSGDATRRWLGTFYTTSTTTTEDSIANRYLANYYNQVPRYLNCNPTYSDNNSANTITTTSTTWIRLNGGTGDSLNYVIAGAQAVVVSGYARAVNSSANDNHFGVAPDSTAAGATQLLFSTEAATGYIIINGVRTFQQTDGRHFAQIMWAVSSGTGTYYADAGRLVGSSVDNVLSGFNASVMG